MKTLGNVGKGKLIAEKGVNTIQHGILNGLEKIDTVKTQLSKIESISHIYKTYFRISNEPKMQ